MAALCWTFIGSAVLCYAYAAYVILCAIALKPQELTNHTQIKKKKSIMIDQFLTAYHTYCI